MESDNKLTKTQLEELIRCFEEKSALNPSWRKGQTWFNCLNKLYPSVANSIRTTKNDPFYRDDRIDDFFKAITI